jgi:hypothetical protein
VEGPPGTGKSHTIANLVCHFLATGQRVLVTSHTARALNVLHNKFAEGIPEIAPLCVVALGNDPRSAKQLEHSVLAITQRYSGWSQEWLENAKQIHKLESCLEETRRKETVLSTTLRQIREIEVHKHDAICGGYSGTVMQIARSLRAEEFTFGWIAGRTQGDVPPLSNVESVELLRLLRCIDRTKQAEIEQPTVCSTELIVPDQFARYVEDEYAALGRLEDIADIRNRTTTPTLYALYVAPIMYRKPNYGGHYGEH